MKERIIMTRVPFDYHWPRGGGVSVVRHLGEYPIGYGRGEIDPDIAAAAISAGYAQRAVTTEPGQGAMLPPDATEPGQSDRMDRANLASADCASGDLAMAATGQRQ